MRPLARWVAVFVALSVPGLALAAAGEQQAGDQWLKLALLGLNSWIASRIAPLEKRVEALERRR